jgi:hypothetical protein
MYRISCAAQLIVARVLRKLADWLEPTEPQLQAAEDYLTYGSWLR